MFSDIRRRCSISAIPAPSKNVTTCWLTYLLFGNCSTVQQWPAPSCPLAGHVRGVRGSHGRSWWMPSGRWVIGTVHHVPGALTEGSRRSLSSKTLYFRRWRTDGEAALTSALPADVTVFLVARSNGVSYDPPVGRYGFAPSLAYLCRRPAFLLVTTRCQIVEGPVTRQSLVDRIGILSYCHSKFK